MASQTSLTEFEQSTTDTNVEIRADGGSMVNPEQVLTELEHLAENPEAMIEMLGDDALAAVRNQLKEIENVAEEARKESVEEEMERRMDERDATFDGATHIEQKRTYVADEEGAIKLLQQHGISPQQVMEVNASDLGSVIEDHDLSDRHLGTYTVEFFRRS